MKIKVGYAQTRKTGDYENNKYEIEIEDDVRDNEIDDPRVTAARLFAYARKIVNNQKEMDGLE